jgi:hypothetical protein
MRRCKRLRRLRKTLNRRVARLERRIRVIAGVAGHKDRDMIVAHVAIEALNAWTVFSRSYYLSCALGALTERKKYVTIAPTGDPIGAAITCINRWARPTAAGAWHRRDAARSGMSRAAAAAGRDLRPGRAMNVKSDGMDPPAFFSVEVAG